MKTGIDRIAQRPELVAHLGRIGIVTNQACATSLFTPTAEVVHQAARAVQGSRVTAVFGPQHGYGQTEQDNMIETPDATHAFQDGTRVPLYSLYSETRIPKKEQLEDVDTLVVDLIDIGCRVYTYMLTLAGCLKAAAEHGKRVIVLDRPNPLGLSRRSLVGERYENVEGNLIDLTWHSFVGWYAIPMRHGLTLGELGKLFIARDRLNVEYDVVMVEGVSRHTRLADLARMPWTLPSPNIPSWASAFLFPAFVTLEGTNVSEGRGTTLPFQIVGAPYLDAAEVKSRLEGMQSQSQSAGSPAHGDFSGVTMRPHDFRPTFNDHKGQICKGLQFHVASPERVNAFALGVSFVAHVIALHPEQFAWEKPGYEYNFRDPPILLILGHDRWTALFERARTHGWSTETQAALDESLAWADGEAQAFARETEAFAIYP